MKGKKIGGSTPGGTATLMADAALKHLGFQAGRDVTIVPLRENRLAALESGAVDAALLGVPENILAVDRGYNELLFVGDIVNFPQNAIGASVKRIQESPDEVYGMVRAALRALNFVLEPRNRDEVITIVMKQWKLTDRRIATEMLRQFNRGMARDLMAKPEGMQLMIDLVREDSKVTQPFTIAANRRLQLPRKSPPRSRCEPLMQFDWNTGFHHEGHEAHEVRNIIHPKPSCRCKFTRLG